MPLFCSAPRRGRLCRPLRAFFCFGLRFPLFLRCKNRAQSLIGGPKDGKTCGEIKRGGAGKRTQSKIRGSRWREQRLGGSKGLCFSRLRRPTSFPSPPPIKDWGNQRLGESKIGGIQGWETEAIVKTGGVGILHLFPLSFFFALQKRGKAGKDGGQRKRWRTTEQALPLPNLFRLSDPPIKDWGKRWRTPTQSPIVAGKKPEESLPRRGLFCKAKKRQSLPPCFCVDPFLLCKKDPTKWGEKQSPIKDWGDQRGGARRAKQKKAVKG